MSTWILTITLAWILIGAVFSVYFLNDCRKRQGYLTGEDIVGYTFLVMMLLPLIFVVFCCIHIPDFISEKFWKKKFFQR